MTNKLIKNNLNFDFDFINIGNLLCKRKVTSHNCKIKPQGEGIIKIRDPRQKDS